MTVHVTLELTEDQSARLEQLAARNKVSVSQYLFNTAEEIARRDAEFRALVQEGIAEARRGELHDHEDVVETLEAHIAAVEARRVG